MAVGLPLKTTYADGDVYSASDVNDTNGTINLFQTSTLSRSAGKNAVINGGFDIWQRGTTFTSTNNLTYLADRWLNSTGTSLTVTRDTDVPTSPYFTYSMKMVGTGDNSVSTRIESANSIPLAGQTVTLSFYAKRTSGTGALDVRFYYPSAVDNFASNTQIGSTSVVSSSPSSSWTRYSATVSIGTNIVNGLQVLINNTGASTTFITGVQLELGSYATTFSRAGGSIGGELALCQRYYERINLPTGNTQNFGIGTIPGINVFDITYNFKVEKRSSSQTLDYANVAVYVTGFGVYTGGTITVTSTNTMAQCVRYTHTSSPWSGTQVGWMYGNTSGAYLGFSAEL